MKEVSELHYRVIDKGLFLPIARRLAREALLVTYWTPHDKAFETLRDRIGDGFPDITRVRSIWQDKGDVDIWVFPDIGFEDEQRELVAQGFPVWGPRGGDELETMRGKFLNALGETELPVPPHQVCHGLSDLLDHLRDKEDQYVKISTFRGDWETYHWRSFDEDENELEERCLKFGPFKEDVAFYVFSPIDTKIEDGCDSWCIDGRFPSLIIHGMEAKDKAYLGAWQKFADLPEEMRRVSEAFYPILAGYGYRSFFSTEVRITDDGQSYFIDPTCRAGSPPSQVMTEMIANYAEIIWAGANGELVEPEPAAKFGVQALLKAKTEHHSWGVMKVDDELDRWAKCGNCLRRGDLLCFPHEHESSETDLGWLVGIGDTMDEAIRHLRHNVELLPDKVSCEFSSLADLLKEVKEAEEQNMKFSDQPVPEPETILDDKT